jgi:hypothetical protein
MMGKEIELKLEVPPQELRRLKGWRALSGKGSGEQDSGHGLFRYAET